MIPPAWWNVSSVPSRSSRKWIAASGLRKESSLSRRWTVALSKTTVSNTVASGLNRCSVPVPSLFPIVLSGATGAPRSYRWKYVSPSLRTVTSNHSESALTTWIPTPWRPPETLYVFRSNFDPAWRTVRTISRVGRLYFGWISTGIPRPLSATEQVPSSWRVTVMSVQHPARTSSIELSTTSSTSCCSPRPSVDPMYIPGRFRTAERPSRIWIELALYSAPWGASSAIERTADFSARNPSRTPIITLGPEPKEAGSERRVGGGAGPTVPAPPAGHLIHRSGSAREMATPPTGPRVRTPAEIRAGAVAEGHKSERADRLEDSVFGVLDGVITAISLSVATAGVARIGHAGVLLTIVAAAVAGSLSMFTGALLSGRAKADLIRSERAREEREVDELPEEERREVHDIYRNRGLTEEETKILVDAVTSNKRLWVDTMMREELGLPPYPEDQPIAHAGTIGVFYLIGGILAGPPLSPHQPVPLLRARALRRRRIGRARHRRDRRIALLEPFLVPERRGDPRRRPWDRGGGPPGHPRPPAGDLRPASSAK